VDTHFLEKTEEMATGVGFIILNKAGENGIILDMGSNKLMDTAFVDRVEEQISKSDIVMSVLEIPVEAAARAMELGRKHDVPTILNPAPATKLSNKILKDVSYLTPNETELRILMGLAPDDKTPTPELAKKLCRTGVENLIVTMGEKGALILSGDNMTEVQGVDVDVVDTTGAGDAFNAGLAVAIATGWELVEAVKFANCAGALACNKFGVIPALGKRDMVEEFYAKAYI
jgi:ribokinase